LESNFISTEIKKIKNIISGNRLKKRNDVTKTKLYEITEKEEDEEEITYAVDLEDNEIDSIKTNYLVENEESINIKNFDKITSNNETTYVLLSELSEDDVKSIS